MMSNADEGSIAWALFVHFAMLSLMSIGGGMLVLMPDMQRFVVDANHWMTNENFVSAYTIAQVAPGPNVLFVALIGLQAAGLLGAIATTLAIILPPAAITVIALRVSAKKSLGGLGRVVKTALSPLSVGMMLAAAGAIAKTADKSWEAALLTLLTATIFLRTKLNPLWLIAAGAVLGILDGLV